MTGPQPDLQQRLRDLAEARIREQVAAAATARKAAVDARAAQAERRHHGVTARNTAKAARLRLTERHNQTEENQK